MEKSYLYKQIADSIRQKILEGDLKSGDRLPSVRAMMEEWNCTIGTVQHAYQDLAAQGLITSRAGRGTRVLAISPSQSFTPLRKAELFHRAEAFLLEVLTAGFTPEDAEEAVRQALDRWRSFTLLPLEATRGTFLFSGSHDLAITRLATHFSEKFPEQALKLSFSGSLGGLIALAEGKADLAGCHLWDAETNTYNRPFIQRLLPGRRVALVQFARRKLGLILAPGNPKHIASLVDLTQPEIRFINRQSGSGTRVWLDGQLSRLGIPSSTIEGYGQERITHSEVARAIAENQADTGIGLEDAAAAYGLDFTLLTYEQYDLVIPEDRFNQAGMQAFLEWLRSSKLRQELSGLAGYDFSQLGQIEWLNPGEA